MFALVGAASIVTAVDAERAFIRDAQVVGQWTAFRKWAHPDAVMFGPQAVWAQDYLKDARDPPKAIDWAPADSWVSCDGRTAINRGPWTSASGKAHGYFTTVWIRDGKQWNWHYDGGDNLSEPMAEPAQPRVQRASCSGRSSIPAEYRAAGKPIERVAGKVRASSAGDHSADGTLVYEWSVSPDGARHFVARLWDGRAYRTILDQNVTAPKQ